jgi:decaprenylphospho-beta-D-ribofuranose 2-oxidase
VGRGLLEMARPSPENVRDPMQARVSIPFDCPASLLNRYSMRVFNEAYFRSVPNAGRVRRVHVNQFLFPLDAIHNWNRLYGRNGLFQFQCAVPFSDAKRALSAVMAEVLRSGCASFLGVIKSMKRRGPGMLSFPMPGISLALDFSSNPKTRALIERLYDIILAHGGRAYLAKDACLSAKQFESMYPEVDRFRAVLRRVDPGGIMQSDMSRRLKLRAG